MIYPSKTVSVARFVLHILFPSFESKRFIIYLFIRYYVEVDRNRKCRRSYRIGYESEVIPDELHRSIVKRQTNGAINSDNPHQIIVPIYLFQQLYSENIFYRDGKSLWTTLTVKNGKSIVCKDTTQGDKHKSHIKNTLCIKSGSKYCQTDLADTTFRVVQIIPCQEEFNDNVYLTETELFNLKTLKNYSNDFRIAFQHIRSPILAPQIASEVCIQMVTPSVYIGSDLVDMILNNYFATPKFLHPNDYFVVSLTEELTRHLHLKYLIVLKKMDKIYFKCVGIKSKNCINNKISYYFRTSNKLTNVGYFIVKGETQLVQEQNFNSLVPPFKHVFIKNNPFKGCCCNDIENYYVEACPYALNKYLQEIKTSIQPFLLDKQVNPLHTKLKCVVQPVFLLRGVLGAGCRILVNNLADYLGLNLISETCRRIVSTTAKQTEARIDAIFQKAKNVAPVLVHLQEFDIFGVDAEKNEDIRIVDYLTKKLKDLYENFTKYPVIFIANCDLLYEMKPNLLRIFLEEFTINSPNRKERIEMLIWLVTTRNLVFYDENFEKPFIEYETNCHKCKQTSIIENTSTKDVKIKRKKNKGKGKHSNVNSNTVSTSINRNKLFSVEFQEKRVRKILINENIFSLLDKIASKTESLVFGDLETLTNLSIQNGYLACIDKVHCGNDKEVAVKSELSKSIVNVRLKDFEDSIETLRLIQSKKLGTLKIPNIQWEDVGGLEDLKKEIFRTIDLPLKFPHLLAKSGLKRSGLLLWGPPGCGKTLVARAIASQLKAAFLSVKGPELLDMYVGQSEKNMRDMFAMARASAPCVIFLDEAEAAAGARGASGDAGGAADRLVSQLLAELDGVAAIQHSAETGPVIVVAATNRPDLVEPALLRPGRLDKLVYVGPYEGQVNKVRVLKAACRGFNLSGDADLDWVADQLPDKSTGADLAAVVNNARKRALAKTIHLAETGEINSSTLSESDITISKDDFKIAISHFVPSIPKSEMDYYESLKTKLS